MDEDKQTGVIEVRRKNGRRGFASAIVQTVNLQQGAGAATGSDIVPIEEADFISLQEPVLFGHYASTVLDKPMYNTSVGYSTYFVDAAYYSDLSDTYRALLPHAFEPPEGSAGSNVYERMPPESLYDEDGDWISDYSGHEKLSPAFGFEGLGWQLQDGDDGVRPFVFNSVKDSLIEGNETAKFKLSVPRGYIDLGGSHIPTGVALGRTDARMLIMDDDFTQGELRFSSSDFYVNEADRTATLNVERVNGANGSISVQFKTRAGTATTPFDYRSKEGSLRFASGQTSRSITLSVVDDETQEVDEYFDVDIFNVTGGASLFEGAQVLTLRIFLVDNDLKGGKVEFAADSAQVKEDEGEVTVAVRRIGGSRGQASVAYSTSSIDANSGEDYQPVQGVLSWAHQDVTEKQIQIPIIDNNDVEGAETFEVTLANPKNVILGQRNQIIVSVEDDDDAGEVVLGDSHYFLNENGAELTVYVERQGGAKGNIKVDYSLSDGTASSVGDFPDYVISSGTLYFEDGQNGQSITVQILDDFATENTEFFNLTLSNPAQGAVIGSPAQAKINIVDDETVNVPAGSIDTFFDTGVGIRVNGPVEVIKRDSENNLLLAGEFTVINGILRKGIAKLSDKGELDNEFNVEKGTNGLINDIFPMSDGSMIVVGDFTKVGGTVRNRIAKINSDGYLNDSFDPGSGFDGVVHSIVPLSDGTLLIVGRFQNYKGKSRRGLVVLDSDALDVTPWSGQMGSAGAVSSAVQLHDGSLILAGDFEQFGNNEFAQKVARIDANGKLNQIFTENFSDIYQKKKFNDGHVTEVLLHPDGNLILVGDFTINTVSGRSYTNLIKISPMGELITGASPEDILAADEARVAAEAVGAQLAALQAELLRPQIWRSMTRWLRWRAPRLRILRLLRRRRLSSETAAAELATIQADLEAATAALEQANEALALADAKAAEEGATPEDIAGGCGGEDCRGDCCCRTCNRFRPIWKRQRWSWSRPMRRWPWRMQRRRWRVRIPLWKRQR